MDGLGQCVSFLRFERWSPFSKWAADLCVPEQEGAEHCFVVEDSISFLLALDVDPQVARTRGLESMETSLSDGTY
eukprot:scaffold12532_cov53-Attheya_sp.AAC.3